MLPEQLAGETVTILTPVMVDDRGTLMPDWARDPSRREIVGCAVQPSSSGEELGGRQQTEARLRVWLPALAVVSAVCRLEWRGVVHAVDGPPQIWRDPLGRLDHQTVDVVRQEG